MPATSAGLPRVSYFFSFLFLLQWPFTVLIKQTWQAVRTVKQSIYSKMPTPVPGNIKGGYITVLLTSCLTDLD